MFKRILLVFVVLIGLLLAYAATRPDTFRVERAVVIQAPPAKVFALIDDFHRWSGWSPWEKRDPAMKRTHSGAASGKGAVYAWQGNSDVGAGRMEILETSAPSRVLIRLDFLEPFAATNTAEYTIVPEGDASRVTWAMHGPAPFVSKLMQVFVSMDKMIGKDFEQGLASLKALAER
ncbi:MAG TPA: SRPBCC family protein [Burkholderiaceae bacterium]|nr:SRPBCC family protein [Burkholderiaceae bacterium]